MAVGVVVVVSVVLMVVSAVEMLVALMWGPGQREALVDGDQPGVVAWFGLPLLGTSAATLALAWCGTPRHAIWPLLGAATSLGAWVAGIYLFLGPD